MKTEYDTFVDRVEDLREGEEMELVVRDLSPGPKKYEHYYVRAQVASSSHELSGGEVLWLRFPTGILYPKPWVIKITQKLEALPK